MTTTQKLFDLTATDIMSRKVVTVPREASLSAATHVLVQAKLDGSPVVNSHARFISVFSTTDRASPTKLEKRAGQKAPCVPACVYSDWQLVENDWHAQPAESVSSDMTVVPVPVPPETWIG